MAIEFNDSSAKEAIESGRVTVIDFWATWCGPCIKLGPIVEELATNYDDKALIGKINIDEESDIVSQYAIRSIPTILFFKDGNLVDRCVGLVRYDELEARLLPLIG